MKLTELDHPLVFLLIVWMGVIALSALASYLFVCLGWSGPLGLVKGGATR